jgi:hypothetical protein
VFLFDFYFVIELQVFNNSITLYKKNRDCLFTVFACSFLFFSFFFLKSVYVYVFSLIKIVILDLKYFFKYILL